MAAWPCPTTMRSIVMKPDDICPRPETVAPESTEPMAQPIYLASVYACEDPDQASRLLSGETGGYVYRRDGHPNADALSRLCARLHGADQAAVCASGMAALGMAALAQLQQGDHVVLSNQLYGRTQQLFSEELNRLGVRSTTFDPSRPGSIETAFTPQSRLVVVETIANPILQVVDLAQLAEAAHRHEALLLVDNTLASPVICRPLEFGADIVVESLTKIANGHSDVLLGMICGRADIWQRVPQVLAIWGATASPMDCWLAQRGMGTLALRVDRATANAAAVAKMLAADERVATVHYPGLQEHPNRDVAVRQFGGRFGWMVTFTLAGHRDAAAASLRPRGRFGSALRSESWPLR